MIDQNSTTYDWQVFTGDVCVLPVGSVEQHSHHMPLITDSIKVEYFARMLAEELDAALLPPVAYANCLEHSGFRGSVSLRPETLMHVVRDIADAMEEQNFRILVVLNGHGGNFALKPAIRDINRQDRGLKILLVDYWLFGQDAVRRDSEALGGEIHSGEWETSVMMALFPDLVREPQGDMESPGPGESPLEQADLTTFGSGHFNANGAIGFPSYASAEKGRAIVETIRQRLPAYVRARIARLRKSTRYAGPGGIAVRPMIESDIPAGMRLKELAGWNQVEADWRLFLESVPAGCFAAVHNGAVVGTVTTVRYGNGLSWIGMLLVDPAFRRMGIGRTLMEMAVEASADAGVVALDAAAAGRGLYAKLGFAQKLVVQRMVCNSVPPQGDALDGVEPVCESGADAVLAFDAEAFGVDRSGVLRSFVERCPELAWCLRRAGRVTACCFGRDGSAYGRIGPVVGESIDDARSVVTATLRALAGRPVVIDVPDTSPEFVEWLNGRGFTHQRSFTRMTLRDETLPGIPERQFAVAGGAFG